MKYHNNAPQLFDTLEKVCDVIDTTFEIHNQQFYCSSDGFDSLKITGKV